MDSFFLRKYVLWPFLCVFIFILLIRQGDLDNSLYNESVKKQYYCVKVVRIRKLREYYVDGIDTAGRHVNLVISPKWNLQSLQIGDSIAKKANSYEIKIITKHKSITINPELPL